LHSAAIHLSVLISLALEFLSAFAGEFAAAANAYYKSVQLGNHTDWQALVELCCDYPNLKLS
jgi:hypothetical protein